VGKDAGKETDRESSESGSGRATSRALWTGTISFGLVNIPVRLVSATKSHDIAFHQVEDKTGKRIHNRRVVEGGTKEVPFDHIVKGYEVSKGKIVRIEPAELKSLAPEKTSTIDIEDFVDLSEIDPLYWDATYFVGPDDRAGAAKSYVLLRKAMEETNKVGIGRFVMRTKEYLATVRPLGSALALETMFYADEIRSIEDIVPASVKKVVAPASQVALAKQLIKSLEGHFDPKRYKDTFRDRVLDLIKKKGRGEEIEIAEETEKVPEVVDLMEALKASLSGGGGGKGAGKKSPARATASKTTAKSAPGRRKRAA
jgi:DNA end-binding protein Ku